MSRTRAVANRWLSMISCGILGAVIGVLLQEPLRNVLLPVTAYLASLPPAILSSGILLISIAACWPLGNQRWAGFFGYRHVLTYPPLWVAGLIATLMIVGSAHFTALGISGAEIFATSLWFLPAVPLWLWFVIAAAGFLHARQSKPRKRKPQNTESDPAQSTSEFDALVAWLRDDREIEDPQDDRFGHDDVARRIVERLTAKGESPTMAVVGPLGSGKSTIRALVKHRLSEPEHRSVQMVHLSLWPFDSAEAAVAGILQAVVRTLGKNVNILAVSGLSEQYVSLIERVGGPWGAFARLLYNRSSPEAILQRLASIATAAGIKIVLWIEDMERFTGSDRLPPEQAAIREAERLGPIQSLLVLLDRCESISVIVADTSLRSRIDVGKIARFVESPSRMSPQTAWATIATLRTACLSENFIDPANTKYREQLSFPTEDTAQTMWFWSMSHNEPRVQKSIAMLLNTPRSLKSTLRTTLETWEKLRGEIDFDSVLAATTLRVTRPDIFAVIDEHTNSFRSGLNKESVIRVNSDEIHPVHAKLESYLDREPSQQVRNAIKSVITFVFPQSVNTLGGHVEGWPSPQSLSINSHADYWNRYLALPDVPKDKSDQAALRDIAEWKASRADLVPRLLDPYYAEQLETFANQFAPNDLCRLLAELCGALRESSALTWEDRHHAPGMKQVWRLMLKRTPSQKGLFKTISELVRDLTPHNLPLVTDVYYYYATHSPGTPMFLDDAERSEIRRLLINSFSESFAKGSAISLLRAVRGGSPYVVYWICWGIERARARQLGGQPFDEWRSVSELLLETAAHAPEQGVLIILPFITKTSRVVQHEIEEDGNEPSPIANLAAEFDEEAARRLFDFDRLIHLLEAAPTPSNMNEELTVQFHAAQQAAQRLIATESEESISNESGLSCNQTDQSEQSPFCSND